MTQNTSKSLFPTHVNSSVGCRVLAMAAAVTCALLASAPNASAAVINQTLCVSTNNKTMSDGQVVTFWGFTPTCRVAGNGEIPGPPVEVGIGDTLNLTLSFPMGMPMTTPMEPMPYMGHTIHLHGADVPTAEDGVPETGATVMGDTYTWLPTGEMGGTYMYHCHVHTVKHLEMGMYGPLIVRPKNALGNFLNQLTPDAATTFDFVQTYLLSSVDPAYHTAIGDSPVFADYNPKYFLLNGKESVTSTGATVSAETLAATQNSKVALRLIGLHAVKGTFKILDSAGNAKPFTVYVQDGRQWPTPETVTSLDIGPAQRFDIIFTTPSSPGTWYPEFEYQKLRDPSPGVKAPYAKVFGSVTF